MENRREFLKNGLLLCLGAGGMLSHRAAYSFSHEAEAQWGLIIDTRRCMGCQACMVACKLQSQTAQGRFHTTIYDREIAGNPHSAVHFEVNLCRHCSNAPCVSACTTGAAFKHASGLVLTDWQRCDGNGACINACPYNARFADPRFENRADKCDLCFQRLARGLVPACVENCSAGARIFGRFDAPKGEFAHYLTRLAIPAADNQRPAGVIIHYPNPKRAT